MWHVAEGLSPHRPDLSSEAETADSEAQHQDRLLGAVAIDPGQRPPAATAVPAFGGIGVEVEAPLPHFTGEPDRRRRSGFDPN